MSQPVKRGFVKNPPYSSKSRYTVVSELLEQTRLFRSPDIFLCHNSKDKKFVRKLSRDLNRVGVDGWLDEWELEAGDSLHACIGNALLQCKFVGVIISPTLGKSSWCLDELSQSLAREKREKNKVVIPLLYKRATPPPFLEDRVYLNFSKSYVSALARLSGMVHGLSMRRLNEHLLELNPKTVPEVADILSMCGWDGNRLCELEDFKEFRREMHKLGIRVGNVFKFPNNFEKYARLLMHLRVVRDIYGED